MSTPNRSRELMLFFAWTLGLTFLVCWGPLAVFRIPGASVGGGAGAGLVPFVIGGFIPSLVGLVMVGRTEGKAGFRRLWQRTVALRFPLWIYGVIVLVNFGVGALRLGVQWGLGTRLQPAETLTAMLENPVLWIAFFLQALVLGPLSEEFGWRGYAQDRVTERFGPLGGSLVLGSVWALWHLPLFFIPGTSQAAAGEPVLSFLAFALFVISMTVVMTWVYNRTGRSLGAAILMHTLMPFVAGVVSLLMPASLLDGMMQALGYLGAAGLVLLVAGPALGARPAGAGSQGRGVA